MWDGHVRHFLPCQTLLSHVGMLRQQFLMPIAVWIELEQIEKLEGQIEVTLKVGFNWKLV